MQENYILESMEQKNRGGHWRPAYHFTPPEAWLNDPNGLIYFKGWYHLFYQHNPRSCEWGQMHWGHAVSRDMFHWHDLPIALHPDQSYDNGAQGGCFSGTAVEKDGKLYLFYTSVAERDGKNVQTQSLAFSEDGVHFQKYEGNPVLTCTMPESTGDFRDPKVLEYDGVWYMLVGSSVKSEMFPQGDGRIFFYRSEDIVHWEFVGNLLESNGMLGTMFECPDLFFVDGKWVLTCSPINHPQYQKAMYCVGDMDFQRGSFQIGQIGELDAGFDYYAPQSFEDKAHNRMVMAWANGWQWMPCFTGTVPTACENWRGAMTLPRKVELDKTGVLTMSPPKELDSLFGQTASYENITIDAEKHYFELPDAFGYAARLEASDCVSGDFEVGIFDGKGKHALITVDFAHSTISFDKNNADDYGKGVMSMTFTKKGGKLELLILADHSIVEIYANGKCMTCNVYPEKEQTGFWMAACQSTVIQKIEISKVEAVWE